MFVWSRLGLFWLVNCAWSVHISHLFETRWLFHWRKYYYEWRFEVKNVLMDLFLTNRQLFSSQDVNWWSGVDYCGVLSAVWTPKCAACWQVAVWKSNQVSDPNLELALHNPHQTVCLRWALLSISLRLETAALRCRSRVRGSAAAVTGRVWVWMVSRCVSVRRDTAGICVRTPPLAALRSRSYSPFSSEVLWWPPSSSRGGSSFLKDYRCCFYEAHTCISYYPPPPPFKFYLQKGTSSEGRHHWKRNTCDWRGRAHNLLSKLY